MSLETAGNIAALFGGAVKGYQDQSEIELKKQQLKRDEELKRLSIEAGLMEKGLVKSDTGAWNYSPEAIEKMKLDRDYKQAQIGATQALEEFRRSGGLLGNQIKAVKEGIEFDPITGMPMPGEKMKALDKITLDYKKAQIDKLMGNVNVPEAASVEAKNKIEADLKRAEMLSKGYKLLPDGNWEAPKEQPFSQLEEKQIQEALSQGYKYNPRTGESVKLPWAKKEKPEKEKDKKTLPATQTVNLSSGKAAVNALEDLRGIIEKNKHEFGFKKGLINKGKAFLGGKGGTTARTLQSDLQTRGQILSKFLEQGKLSDKDREFYLSQVPTLTDSPESAFNKISTLSRIVEQLHNQNLEGFDVAGYDVSKFTYIPLTGIRTLKTEKYDTKTQDMIDIARKAINSKASTEQQKINARNFLKSKGIQ